MRYLLLILLLCYSCKGEYKYFKLSREQNHVKITFQNNEKYLKRTLLRSHFNFVVLDTLSLYDYPITEIELPVDCETYVDSLVASDTKYYYLLIQQRSDGRIIQAPAQWIQTETAPIPTPDIIKKKLNLLVDKRNYLVELRDGAKVIKRYPTSLGQDPFNRKIEKDLLSTPEGIYHCNYLKPKSQFHKAIGVNYPNKTDRKRFNNAVKEGTLLNSPPDIGGAIQLHGGGIGHNWTWGCMAMRNEDIDELFFMKVKAYTPIFIVGTEITRDSLPY